jgi:cell division protease FtsH
LAILKVHSNGKPLAEQVDLEVLARQTAGFSGADLANLINEAAILSARRNKKVIDRQELEESIDRVIAGPERKSRKIGPKDKEITAYHEAGHALVARMLPNADPVHKISIVARGMSLGHTRQLPTEDRYLLSRSQFNDMIATFLAGHIAEDLVFSEMTTGGHDDIQRATKLARMMVTDYGMSEKLGPRTFGEKQEMVFLGREISEQRDYSDKIAEEIDEEVHNIIQDGYEVSKGILTENMHRLKQIAETLMVKETVEGHELEALFTGAISKPAPESVAASAIPAKAKTKARRKTVGKKAPLVPHILPKQTPATSD